MNIQSLSLSGFRNHRKCSFSFSDTTILIGKNTAGKTSLLESLWILSHGRSFKAEYDKDTVNENSEFARIETTVHDDDSITNLTAIFALQNGRFTKKFLVNNVPRRALDFTSHLLTVLFTPEDLEIITASPSIRRGYINSILSQSDKKYRASLLVYEKALKHRNRMLYLQREGKKHFGPAEFEYWDNLLIEHGGVVTSFREDFVRYLNTVEKAVFPFSLYYDTSTITRDRLDKYKEAELASATTLVGPQRDEFVFHFEGTRKQIKELGSRGEQRLTIFQTKLLETQFLIERTGKIPILLLDDIFSELDNTNIHKVLDLLPHQQTILTTTHKEFVPKNILEQARVKIIEL